MHIALDIRALLNAAREFTAAWDDAPEGPGTYSRDDAPAATMRLNDALATLLNEARAVAFSIHQATEAAASGPPAQA